MLKLALGPLRRWYSQEWNESFGPDAPLLRDAPSLGVPLSSTGDFPAGLTKGVDGGRDANDASPDAEGISGRGGESSVSPGKVAEALRLLARRAVDAEEGTVEATREKGVTLLQICVSFAPLACLRELRKHTKSSRLSSMALQRCIYRH